MQVRQRTTGFPMRTGHCDPAFNGFRDRKIAARKRTCFRAAGLAGPDRFSGSLTLSRSMQRASRKRGRGAIPP